MHPLTGAGRQIVLLAFSSLAGAAVAIEVASLAEANGLAGAAQACIALLLAAAIALLYSGRRLIDTLRSAEDAAARSRSELQAAPMGRTSSRSTIVSSSCSASLGTGCGPA
jgi:hypothetical protein